MIADEAFLRMVFPDAPADLTVPDDVSQLFKARMRAFGGARRPMLLAAWVGLLALGAILVLAGAIVPGIVVVVGVLVATVVVLVVQHGRASDDFFEAYATARGLRAEEDSMVAARVPLFAKGDKRKWPRVLRGRIAGNPADLALYTYTDVSTDSEGNRTETDHDFTVLRFQLPPAVAARFVGVSLAPKGLSFGALQDKLAHDRAVKLESAEFHDRYSLRVVDSQDDVALYELFSPPFIQLLATESPVYWEQRGEHIVFWRKGHETEAVDLDHFCVTATPVLRRYFEEFQ